MKINQYFMLMIMCCLLPMQAASMVYSWNIDSIKTTPSDNPTVTFVPSSSTTKQAYVRNSLTVMFTHSLGHNIQTDFSWNSPISILNYSLYSIFLFNPSNNQNILVKDWIQPNTSYTISITLSSLQTQVIETTTHAQNPTVTFRPANIETMQAFAPNSTSVKFDGSNNPAVILDKFWLTPISIPNDSTSITLYNTFNKQLFQNVVTVKPNTRKPNTSYSVKLTLSE